MIAWLVTVVLLAIAGGVIVVAEIRDERAWRRYNRRRDEIIERLFTKFPSR